ncbi:hypothetical protein AGMMS50239_19770 [Bacteroidia bacterium]|nr:hypothetical protein AGMMS50239_19770 [Bacteroidia bacterium]
MQTDDFMNEINIPAGLESKLETLINRLDKEEKQSKQKTRQIRLWAGSIAASIAVLISIGLYINASGKMKTSDASQTAIVDDQEVAYREAEKALVLVSLNFNKGLSQLALVSDEMEKTNKTLDKTFKTLRR